MFVCFLRRYHNLDHWFDKRYPTEEWYRLILSEQANECFEYLSSMIARGQWYYIPIFERIVSWVNPIVIYKSQSTQKWLVHHWRSLRELQVFSNHIHRVFRHLNSRISNQNTIIIDTFLTVLHNNSKISILNKPCRQLCES